VCEKCKYITVDRQKVYHAGGYEYEAAGRLEKEIEIPFNEWNASKPVHMQALIQQLIDSDERGARYARLMNSALHDVYPQVKASSRRAASRVLRIGIDFGEEAAKAAALACLDMVKAETKQAEDLKTTREELERLRRLLKINGIKIAAL
jgi:hypothetical protein